MSSLRLMLYRAFHRWGVEGLLLPRWMSNARLREEAVEGIQATDIPASSPNKSRAWFHAASVGELESLAPVILKWAAGGGECVLTVLSESARGPLRRLRETLSGDPESDAIVFAGYSPWEGRWRAAVLKVRPDLFVTAKYEAWPELWAALGESGIPLLIVSAKARRSLRLGKLMTHALGARLPRMKLLTVNEKDAAELGQILASPGIEIIQTGEPRWDRVQARARMGNSRAKTLVERFARLPRPWGVLGSVWPEDMEVWRGRLAKGSATLWVVPHRVDRRSVERIEDFLLAAGLRVRRTSEAADPVESSECVLVDEIGVLMELYSAADWAFVGGGFGVSMHSTIEPAIFGIPVACGPNGAEKFPEIEELTGTGQLALIRHGDDLDAWLDRLASLANDPAEREAARGRWLGQASARLGATDRIVEIMRKPC